MGGGSEPAAYPERLGRWPAAIGFGVIVWLELAVRLEGGRTLAAALDSKGVAVDPLLLGRLGVKLGDTLSIGTQSFTIRGVIAREPDRLGATKPGRDAAFQKLLDEADPEGILSEAERLKLVTRLIRSAIKRLDFAERAQARARSNGKVHFPG